MSFFKFPKKRFGCICLLLLSLSLSALGQNQKKADSLKTILAGKHVLSPVHQMAIMADIATHSSSPDEVLLYADKLLVFSSKYGTPAYTIDAYHYKGVAYRLKGNLKTALKNLFLCAALASSSRQYEQQAEAYEEISNTYSSNNDLANALLYNKKALKIIRAHGTEQQLAINLVNTGYNYYMLNEWAAALRLYNEAAPIFNKIGLSIGKAYTTGNRALVYWKQGNYSMAKSDLKKAIDMLRLLGDEFGMADYYNQLGKLYAEQGDADEAISNIRKAFEIAQKLHLKEQIRDASLQLAKLYEAKKEYKKALGYKTRYVIYKDSIENTETTKQIADLRTAFEVSLKQKEIALLEKRQLLSRIYIVITIVLLLFAVLAILYFLQRFKHARLMAYNEKKRHDEKIKNLLNTQETKALQSMIKGQENERKRLAQELHNHFGNLLATIKVNLNAIEGETISNHHTLTTLVDQACADIRNLSHQLNMGISENFGLVPALKELTSYLEQANGLEVEFSASESREQMSAENEIVIYRIVQELVSNVLKHAKASKLSVSLTSFDKEFLVNILVQDNGKGFNIEKELKHNSGMGLKSLRKMILDLHGSITFDSNVVSGTTVNIDLPFTPITLH